jgi:lysophospholipase L1-like esterase
MTSSPISRQALIDAATDAETLDKVINNPIGTVTPRHGGNIDTLRKVLQDAANAVPGLLPTIIGQFLSQATVVTDLDNISISGVYRRISDPGTIDPGITTSYFIINLVYGTQLKAQLAFANHNTINAGDRIWFRLHDNGFQNWGSWKKIILQEDLNNLNLGSVKKTSLSVTDYNAITENGFYQHTGAADFPGNPTLGLASTLFHQEGASPRAVQIASSVPAGGAKGGRAQIRFRTSGNEWEDWKPLDGSALPIKKIGALGDSITYGYIPRNHAGYPGRLTPWLNIIMDFFQCSGVNYGVNGNELARTSGMASRFDTMANDCDLIIVTGGTNDVRNLVPLGALGDTTIDTFYGALDVLAVGLSNKYIYNDLPNANKKKIIFSTPIRLLHPTLTSGVYPEFPKFRQAIIDVARKYALPLFDAWNLTTLNPQQFRTLQGTEPGYTGLYNPLIPDGTHPSQVGHYIYAEAIAGFIKTLYR